MDNEIKEDGFVSSVPANATGAGVVGTGDNTKDMTWAPQKRKLRDMIKRKALSDIRGSK